MNRALERAASFAGGVAILLVILFVSSGLADMLSDFGRVLYRVALLVP